MSQSPSAAGSTPSRSPGRAPPRPADSHCDRRYPAGSRSGRGSGSRPAQPRGRAGPGSPVRGRVAVTSSLWLAHSSHPPESTCSMPRGCVPACRCSRGQSPPDPEKRPGQRPVGWRWNYHSLPLCEYVAARLLLIAGDQGYRFECDIEIAPGGVAGLVLFYDEKLYCGLGFDETRFVTTRSLRPSLAAGSQSRNGHWQKPGSPVSDLDKISTTSTAVGRQKRLIGR